jgi:hypothetical protein
LSKPQLFFYSRAPRGAQKKNRFLSIEKRSKFELSEWASLGGATCRPNSPMTGTRSAPVNRSRICAELTRIRQMRKLLSCATCRTTIYAILAARRAVGMTQFRAFVEFTSCMTELQTNNLYRAAKRSL